MKKLVVLAVTAALLAAGAALGAIPRFGRDLSTANRPVVVDNVTGLVWQGCPAGLTGNDCATGAVENKTWEAALAYCEALSWAGRTDWRLPNTRELLSITDDRYHSPAIDPVAFPGTPGNLDAMDWGAFWSSSSHAYDGSFAWYVGFGDGNVGYDGKGYDIAVRCVRSGP